jgi:hypothetical protein
MDTVSVLTEVQAREDLRIDARRVPGCTMRGPVRRAVSAFQTCLLADARSRPCKSRSLPMDPPPCLGEAGGSRSPEHPRAARAGEIRQNEKKIMATHALGEEECWPDRVLQAKQRSLRASEQRQRIHPRYPNQRVIQRLRGNLDHVTTYVLVPLPTRFSGIPGNLRTAVRNGSRL